MNQEIDLDKLDIHIEPPTEEPDRQYYFMAKCREWAKDFERENGRLPKACVVNMGCQMNARDSEKLAGILEQAGYRLTENETNTPLEHKGEAAEAEAGLLLQKTELTYAIIKL